MELTKYEQELKDRSEKIVADLAKLVNSMSFKPDYFIDAMSKEHRTLQQSFTRLCLKWIEYVASDEYRTDGRNEASHEICAQLLKGFNLAGIRKDGTSDFNYKPSGYLPLI